MKVVIASIFLLTSFCSFQACAVTEQEQEALIEIDKELKFLIQKVMYAKSFAREGDVTRINWSNLVADLNELKYHVGLAEQANRNHRKVKNLKLNYVEM